MLYLLLGGLEQPYLDLQWIQQTGDQSETWRSFHIPECVFATIAPTKRNRSKVLLRKIKIKGNRQICYTVNQSITSRTWSTAFRSRNGLKCQKKASKHYCQIFTRKTERSHHSGPLTEKTQSSKAQSMSETKYGDVGHLKTHPFRSNRLERMSEKVKNTEVNRVKLTV